MVDLDVLLAEFSDCLGLSESDGPNFWVGKDYCWNIFVREIGVGKMRWAEEPIGKMASCCYGDCPLSEFSA